MIFFPQKPKLYILALLSFLLISQVGFAQSKTPLSDVMIHSQGRYGYITNGGYSSWNYGALETESEYGSLSLVFALHSNFNIYGGVGFNRFVLKDPNISGARFTQKIHLDYRAGALVSLGFLYADLGWRYNPVSGEITRGNALNKSIHENKYQFHDLSAKLGMKFNVSRFVLAGGIYQHEVIGKQTRTVSQVQGDSAQELSSSTIDFSEQSPLAVFGTVMYKVNAQQSFGIDLIYRDTDYFILQLTYLKVVF